MKKIIICAEASAVHLKNVIAEYLKEKGYDFYDATENENMTYIEAGSAVGRAVSEGKCDLGIVMCGSGMGVNLVANRFKGVYCGLCETIHTARMARTITNCNVLSLGGNLVAYDLACRMVDAFINAEFLEGFDEKTAAGLKGMFADMEAVDKAERG